ncbi:lipid droplet-associated protein [Prauserella aidingensis]|uniref:lipid droplet-associated protein n=1 Tax=Prauserella aidingensis TaxID=387890 RepID=UPI0020A4BE8A|nr:lipid droplet-associated protein [Prauserella aidingensis]
MKHFPFPVRVAAGLAASTADTVRDLPKHLTELPVTVASQVLQTSMRVQQHVTELAIKGDDALAAFRGVEDEPNWATFDEDDDPAAAWAESDVPGSAATFDDPWDAESQALGEDHEDGEFDAADTHIAATGGPVDTAGTDPTDGDTDTSTGTGTGDAASAASPGHGDTGGSAATTGGKTSGSTPARASTSSGPAGVSDYDDLSLPELRSRLRSFSSAELEQILEYERGNENRPSFTGMLSRRIANVQAESDATGSATTGSSATTESADAATGDDTADGGADPTSGETTTS